MQFSSMSLAAAEDLYQDAFIAVQDNLKRGAIRENTSWQTYIITIGLNMASKKIRTEGRETTFNPTDTEDENQGANVARRVEDLLKAIPQEETPLAENKEAQAELYEEIGRMPEPCATIIRLFYYEKRVKMDDIAEEVGLKNADTAKAKKSQCMKVFRARVHTLFLKLGLTD